MCGGSKQIKKHLICEQKSPDAFSAKVLNCEAYAATALNNWFSVTHIHYIVE